MGPQHGPAESETGVRSIAVYCGASGGKGDGYLRVARAFGQLLAEEGLEVVYGGGKVGLMGAVADGALAAGGRVVGIIPRGLFEREVGHAGVTELRVVESMHDRKAAMAEIADGIVALPGGYGTLDELCEMITWAQLGLHRKPIALLNHGGYYDPLLLMFDRALEEGFIPPAFRALVMDSADPIDLLARMRAHMPGNLARWSDGLRG